MYKRQPKDETNQLKFRFEYDVEPWNELVMLKNLSIKIGERTLLEPFTYTVCRGQRLIIAGPNGAGKSTLMQVLDGKRRPSGGMVRLGTGARPSIFAQQQNRLGQGRVIDVIWNKYPRMTELEVRSHLAKLGFRGDTVFKPCEALSGGELARLRFAEIVLERPNLLFLDEPTNHLDFATMEWLENYLKGYSGAVLVVSHDRYFLDNICTRIWEVSFQTMTTYKGNFSAYLPQKEAADALRQKQHDADVALAEKLQDYVDRNLVRASTTKMAQSRRKQLEKLEITEAPKDETNQLKFRFEYDVEPWNELVLMKNLTIRIGERTLLDPFTLSLIHI